MSRLKNFSRNLTTSYLQLGVNIIYSLVSVPLILVWLPKAEFGLWVMLVQFMSYLTLVDLGINQAIARFLVDHKDRRGDGEYGALVKTSALVSAVQGLIVLAVVTLGSPLLADLLKVPVEYQATFIALMRVQGCIAAFTFCANPLNIMLTAHQRMDVVAKQSMFNLLGGLGLLVLFLMQGCGICAFVYANAITAVVAPCQYFWQCRRLGFMPGPGEWGNASWRQFKEVFFYGKDVFLFNLGVQLSTASQTIIISGTLGLESAAAWSVGTKMFMLVRQIMFQPYNAASAGLCEMVARNEHERLCRRFRNLVVLIASLGAFLGVSFALCNSLFVQVWTGGKIAWRPLNDVLLGLLLFMTSIQTTHCSFVTVTKQIGAMRYIFFWEGASFVALSSLLGYRWGQPGIIGCSLVCLMLFPYWYGQRRTRNYFQLNWRVVMIDWVRPSLKLAAVLALLAGIIWFATGGLPSLWRLIIHSVLMGSLGGFLLLRVGLPPEVVQEAGTRLPRPAARLLGVLAPSHT